MTSPVHDVIKVLTSAFRKKFDDFKGVYLLGQFDRLQMFFEILSKDFLGDKKNDN